MNSTRATSGVARLFLVPLALLVIVALLGPTFERTARAAATGDVVATYSDVSAGIYHTCALTTAGGVQCWGKNIEGQLGVDSPPEYSGIPVDVTGLADNVAAISAGLNHTCIVTADVGGAKCWGLNADGQIGDGSTANRFAPTAVAGLGAGATAIAAGGHHTCALKSDGSVVCWGLNAGGQLGDDSTTSSGTPVTVVGLDAILISAGALHSCAVTTSGGAVCWGRNYAGQLGNGLTTDSHVPSPVIGLDQGVVAVAAGSAHSCALMADGMVKCWGANTSGQLGTSDQEPTNVAIDVVGLTTGAAADSTGSHHTCALTEALGATCWGLNSHGQLGDGTEVNSNVPVDVVGLTSGVARVAAGALHTCIVTATGRVMCWGRNSDGQLGDGTFVSRSVPAAVVVVYLPQPEPDPEPTPEETIAEAIGQIELLLEAGSLNGGQAKALTSTLTAAIKKLESGETVPAVNQLRAFINKVNAQVSAGKLTESEGEELVALAERAIDGAS